MDKDKVAEVLEEAARLYRDEKIEWCQGHWIDRTDLGITMCAEGALMKASGFSNIEIDYLGGGCIEVYRPQVPRTQLAKARFQAATEQLVKLNKGEPRHGETPCGSVVCFNDAPRRTKEEIIDWFEATAKELRNG